MSVPSSWSSAALAGGTAVATVGVLQAGASPWLAALIAAGGVSVGAVAARLAHRRVVRDIAERARELRRGAVGRLPISDLDANDPERQLAEGIGSLADDARVAEGHLTRERDLLQSVADGMTQGVLAVDGQRRVVLTNRAARQMLSLSGTPVGEPLIDVVRLPQLFTLIDSHDADSAELDLAGTRVLIRVGQRAGASDVRVLLLEDVTTMRRLETMRRDFVANVSHELRTPVAVIQANAETLQAGAIREPEMASKLIDGMHRNALRLARLIADLLDLSRLDAGQYRLEPTGLELAKIVAGALATVEDKAAARGVRVTLELTARLSVWADPGALEQVLVNLIDNAIKYTQAEGHVWVRAAVDPARPRDALIEIVDDGPGLAEKHRERVFERFYRADPGRSRDVGGTGLGLAIVKHLTEAMHGEVGVRPHAPRGCVFWLRLPTRGTP